MNFELGADVGYVAETSADGIPEVWIITLGTNQIFALGMPGSAIWLEALDAQGAKDVTDRLSVQYGWDVDVIGMAVTEFLSDLVARGWLKEKV